MIKRPLGFLCLAMVAMLYIFVRKNPAPRMEYDLSQGKSFTVVGKVYRKEAVIQRDYPVSVLYLKNVQDGDTAHGDTKIICYLKAGQPEPELGSCIKVKGKLKTFERASNPGQFDACSYYQISGISYRLNQAEILAKTTEYNHLAQSLYLLRSFLAEQLESNLPEKESAVMCAILLEE